MKPVCLVTGAGGKLGQAICRELSSDYEIIGSYRRNLPAVPSQLRRPLTGKSAASPREKGNGDVYCVEADLTDRADVRRLVEVAIARFGSVDSIVNVAADTSFHGKLLELWNDDAYAPIQLNINCIAPFQLVSAVHQLCWKDQPAQNAIRNRSVVNISCQSGTCVLNETTQAFYSASKAALNILTMYLSLELAPYSVRANALCPAPFVAAASINAVVAAVRECLTAEATGALLPVGS